jgi:hypothetical protein
MVVSWKTEDGRPKIEMIKYSELQLNGNTWYMVLCTSYNKEIIISTMPFGGNLNRFESIPASLGLEIPDLSGLASLSDQCGSPPK